jgi:translocation and assembly module TamB
MRRILLTLAAILILLALAVPTAAVYYLAFTESGLQFIVGRIPHQVGGVQLEFIHPTGTLAHGIHIERAEIDHHLVHVHVEDVQGRVALMPLLWQTIRVPTANIGRVVIQIKRRTKPPIPSEPIFLPRWLIISPERAHIGDVVLTVYNGFRMEATDLLGSAVLRHKTIRIFHAQTQLGDAFVAAIGELRAADPLRIDADARITWSPEGQPAWAFVGTAKGDLNDLAINSHTVAPFRSDFNGHALQLTNHWHWLGDGIVHDFDLRAWGLSGPLGIITGRVHVEGDTRGFRGRGPLNPTGLKVGEFDAEFDGAYAAHVLTVKHMKARHISSGAEANGAGTITIVPHGPRLDLHGTWRDFRWPLVGHDVPVRSPSGAYTLQGILPYDVHLKGIGKVRDLPPMPMQVEGILAKDHFAYTRAEVDLFEGHASVSGAVAWAPAPDWSVSGRATGIDPSYFRRDLPGKLNFTLAVRGRSFDPNGDLDLVFQDIGGKLRGVPASGSGRLARAGAAWQFDDVRVGLGRTSLALDGRVSKQLDLRFAVKAEDLSLLSPESQGQINASGAVRGSLQEPTIIAKAHGTGIHLDGMTLEALDADVDFDPDPAYESRIDARLRNLKYQGRALESLVLTLGGRSTAYSVGLRARANGLDLNTHAVGPFSHGVLQGQIDSLTVTGRDPLRLQLEHPTGFVLSTQRARVEWMCLAGTPASVCADGEWTPTQWAATMTANQLPINTLTAGLTPSVEYQGTVNILARLFGGGQDPVQGTLRIELSDAQLSHRLLSRRVEHTILGSGTLAATATRSAISAEAALEAGEVGTISAKLVGQRTAGRWQDMPIQGEVHTQTGELSLITLYMPEIDRAAGRLVADVNIAGTLGTPLMNGVVKLSDAEVDLYQVNLGLRQLGLEAHLTDNGLDFGGSARIGSGTANTNGHLEWRDSLPYGKFHLQGADLRVVDIPEAQIDASPNLDFGVDGRKIEVTGEVRVPYAKIVPKDLTGAVRASSDEVIVGAESDDPAKRFEVVSTITMALGDRVNIDTTGLTGRLTGNITVRSGYDAITRATGELSVEEGKYTAYARKLDIQRGRLIFTGGPVDNPGIDLRAIKQFPDVTAGINVRGTLVQPRMSFFSEPSLPQSQIVSLILAGGSLETAQSRQSGAGNEALVQGGAILAQQLGSRVGIEDISLESDLTNATSLVLGKYLSPRLYVSYGISLTEQLNTLKLRYSLGDHWTVKTEVGQARGADLVYTIDK